MRIEQLTALEDNFIYMLIDDNSKQSAVVDPTDAQVVLSFLKKNNLTLTTIFNTHHHGDHVGGNKKLIEKFPNALVCGSSFDKGRIPCQNVFLNHTDTITFANETACVYYLPGHTLGHIAYHFKLKSNENLLFIGDTIFSGGCGKLFEGTYSQMFSSLVFLRETLPKETIIYCAHEYTVENYSILAKLEPENTNIKEILKSSIFKRKNNLFTVPFTFEQEIKCSSFFRWDDPLLKKATHTITDLETFTYVRQFRDKN